MTRRLRIQAPPERLAALERERAALLSQIAQKKKAIAQMHESARDLQTALASMAPLLDEARRLNGEVHALFQELLARKRQPRGVRPIVRQVYSALVATGVLQPTEEEDAGLHEDEIDPGELPPGAADERGEWPPSGGGGARRTDRGPARLSIRDLFRRLARSVHPDTVQDGEEKVRRTEVMKEVARAYEDGDLARLVALEAEWNAGERIASAGDEVTRRSETLARTNRALRAQLADLRDELKEMRRALPEEFGALFRPSRRNRTAPDIDRIRRDVDREIAQLREVRDFVASFRNGAIGLDEFIAGPYSQRGPHPDDEMESPEAVEDSQAFEMFLIEMLDSMEAEAPAPRRPQRKRRRRRSN